VVTWVVSDVLCCLVGVSIGVGDAARVTVGIGGSYSFHHSKNILSSGMSSGDAAPDGISGDAALDGTVSVRVMGVDPLDGGSGVILGMISSKSRSDSSSMGETGSAVSSGRTSSKRNGSIGTSCSLTGGATGATGGMIGGVAGVTGGITGGVTGGAAGGMIGGGTMGTVLGVGGMGGMVDDGGGKPPPPLGGLACLFIRFPKV